MGRPRKWTSDAERMAASREEDKLEESAAQDLDEEALKKRFGYAPSENRTAAERQAVADKILKKTSRIPSEEEYVAQALRLPNLIDRDGAERYARWRYRAWLAGEVANL